MYIYIYYKILTRQLVTDLRYEIISYNWTINVE